jgi:hypothetical protein
MQHSLSTRLHLSSVVCTLERRQMNYSTTMVLLRPKWTTSRLGLKRSMIRYGGQKGGSTWTRSMARTGVVGCRLVHISRVVRIHGRFHGEIFQRHIAMTQWLAVSSTTSSTRLTRPFFTTTICESSSTMVSSWKESTQSGSNWQDSEDHFV